MALRKKPSFRSLFLKAGCPCSYANVSEDALKENRKMITQTGEMLLPKNDPSTRIGSMKPRAAVTAAQMIAYIVLLKGRPLPKKE